MAAGRVAGSGGQNSNGAGSSPLSVVMGTSLSVGNRIVVSLVLWGGTHTVSGITCSGATTDTFNQDETTGLIVSDSVDTEVQTWSAPVTGAGTPTLSITWSGTAICAVAFGYSGLSTAQGASAVDAHGTANGSAGSWSATTSGNTTAANQLIIGSYGDSNGANNPTEGGSFTADQERINASAGTALQESNLDAGASGTTETADGTGGFASGWGANVVVYKLAAAAGQTITATGGSHTLTGTAAVLRPGSTVWLRYRK